MGAAAGVGGPLGEGDICFHLLGKGAGPTMGHLQVHIGYFAGVDLRPTVLGCTALHGGQDTVVKATTGPTHPLHRPTLPLPCPVPSSPHPPAPQKSALLVAVALMVTLVSSPSTNWCWPSAGGMTMLLVLKTCLTSVLLALRVLRLCP